jgi:hypothetical protein
MYSLVIENGIIPFSDSPEGVSFPGSLRIGDFFKFTSCTGGIEVQHASLFPTAGLAQSVEQLTLNQLVRGSSPRSGTILVMATLAQLVEHPPCKRTVVGSNPTGGSIAGLMLIQLPNPS